MRPGWFAGLVLLAGGCVPTELEQRVRAYNADGVYLFCRGDYVHARETFLRGDTLRMHPVIRVVGADAFVIPAGIE